MKKAVKIPQVDATDEQIRYYAEVTMGCQISAQDTRPVMIAKLLLVDPSASEHITIEVEDAPMKPIGARKLEIGGKKPNPFAAPPMTEHRLRAAGEAYAIDPHVILVIAKEEKEGGDEPVPCSSNGKAMWIPRGQMVEIPYRYYEALRLAVKIVYVQVDAAGTLEGREVPSYPIDVKWRPSDEVIAEWLKRTDTLQDPNAQAAAAA